MSPKVLDKYGKWRDLEITKQGPLSFGVYVLIGIGSVALLLGLALTTGAFDAENAVEFGATSSTAGPEWQSSDSVPTSGLAVSNGQNTVPITPPQVIQGMPVQTNNSSQQGPPTIAPLPRKYNCNIQITEMSDHPNITTSVVQIDVNVQDSDVHFVFMKLRAGDYKNYFAVKLNDNGIGKTQVMVPIDTVVQVSGYAKSDYRQDSYMCQANS